MGLSPTLTGFSEKGVGKLNEIMIDRLAFYKANIIEKMVAVDTYKPEYEHSIEILAQILVDYDRATEKFIREGSKYVVKHTNKAGATNISKNPLYLTIENLRSEALAYSRELGLTPSGLKKINTNMGKSKESLLAKALSQLE